MIGAIGGALAIGLTLGLLGSGGAILTVPLLVYLLGHTEKASIVESLAIVGIISAFSGARRALSKDIDWSAVVAFGIVSMVGAAAGSWMSHWLTGRVQLLMLAILMLAASWSMLRTKNAGAVSDDEEHRRSVPVLIACGVFVGLATGLLGIGGGFLIVPTLVAAARVEMQRAIGTSLVIIAMNCAVSFAGYMIEPVEGVEIDWGVITLFGSVGIAGSIVGQLVSKKIDRAKLKKIFGVFVLLMAVAIIASRL